MRLALIADVQYSDRDAEQERDYPGALARCARVVARLRERACDLGVQLGDLVDGVRDDPAASREQLERALDTLDGTGLAWEHVLGNHCLRVGREPLLERYGLAQGYHARDLGEWRLVVLDTGERAIHGRDAEDPEAVWARGWLEAHAGEPRAEPWNGAVSDAQLEWLAAELARPEPAVVVGHHPLVPGAGRERFLCWNGEAVADVLAAGGAALYLAGHDHAGGQATHGGVPHVTLPAVLVGEHGAWLELGAGGARLTPLEGAPA